MTSSFTTERRPTPPNGSPRTADRARLRLERPPEAAILSSPASATTTICGRSRSESDGAFAGMAAGAMFIDHTTASATIARELDREAKSRGFGFVDAPVSGGQAGAENGQLTVMCGGDRDDFVKAEPVIAAYARACRLMGPAGAGQLTKMVNQICIAGLVQALAEGLRFAEVAGLIRSWRSTSFRRGPRSHGRWTIDTRR